MGYALSGKTAFVTGANRGIGEAIVDALVAAGVNKVRRRPQHLDARPARGPPRLPRRAAPARCDQRRADRRRRRDRDGRRPPGQQRGHRRLLRRRIHRSEVDRGRTTGDGSELPRHLRGHAGLRAQSSRRMAAAPSPTSTRWPRSSASRFSRRTAPRRPRRTRSRRSRARCCGGRTRRCLACIPARLTPGWARR